MCSHDPFAGLILWRRRGITVLLALVQGLVIFGVRHETNGLQEAKGMKSVEHTQFEGKECSAAELGRRDGLLHSVEPGNDCWSMARETVPGKTSG